jgi:hypothetical protein
MSVADCVAPLAEAPTNIIAGVMTGSLVGLSEEGRTPLVTYPGQPGTAAIAAQSIVDLHGAHIGRRLVIMFEAGDPLRPVIMGLLRHDGPWPLAQQPGTVELDVDGERLTIAATTQLVLRCGEASITLTKAGKVLIRGAYVSSASTGVNRITGGAIHLN